MDMGKGKQSNNLFQYATQIFKMVFLGAIVLACIFTINQFKLSHYFPIKTVRVYGLNRVENQEVQTLLTPLVKQGFFSIDVERIRDRLLQLAWVSDIFVRRNWPDQVEITIIEKNAIARWNGETLLSQAGELFRPKEESLPPDLPELNGPNGKHIVMLEYLTKINRLLMPLHAKISYLELTPYLTWKMQLDNGIRLQIGHKDILTRLNHFVKVYPKIVGDRARDVEYIDLRYSNGLAVRWKTITIKT